SDLKVSKENLKVSQNLLGTTVIAKNIDFATEIAKKLNYGVRIVSLNGDVVNPGGAITGGAVKQKKSGLLEQKLQIEDLQSDIEVIKKNKIRSRPFKLKRIDCKLIEINIVENSNLLR